MSSAHVHALLSPANVSEAQANALALLDANYSAIQSFDDIQQRLEHAERRKVELESKLSTSQSNVHSLVSQTRDLAQKHLTTAQELSLVRHCLADELLYLSRELVSSMSDQSENGKLTLLEDVEALHRNLQELRSVKGYVQTIEQALKLSELAINDVRAPNVKTSMSAPFVQDYKRLQSYVAEVVASCSAVHEESQGEPLQLITFLEKTRDKTWLDIKNALSTSLLEAAERLHWPMSVDYRAASLDERRAFEVAFSNLLRLQDIGEQIHSSGTEGNSERDGLYPLQALVQPISLRFKFHFEGGRETNRPDKPEWYFARILDSAHDHRQFMEDVVQQLLISTAHKNINAWREFTMLLLPLISRKLRRTIPTLIPHPSLLAHTVYQALTFDAALTEQGFGIEGTSAEKREQSTSEIKTWVGVSDIILGHKDWFDAWIDGEKTYAEGRYLEIVSAADAWLITDNEEPAECAVELKSTNSARQIKALVEQTTDRYSPLPKFSQRTRFLISVQLPILEHYHSRVSSSLEAFETLSSAFVRAVPGALGVSLGGKDDAIVHVDTGRLTSGVEGVQRLCKALISTEYIAAAMERWGETVFFLELWTEINHRAALRSRAEANPLLPDPTAGDSEPPSDTIFEELVAQYAKLAARAQDMIVQQVCGEIETGLKTHYASSSPNLESDNIALSQTLLEPIALLSSHLKLLPSILPPATATVLYRRIASRLADHMLQRRILYRGQITAVEGVSILAECELWVETCQAVLGGKRSRIEAPWLKVLQPARLIGTTGSAWELLMNAAFDNDDDKWIETSEGVGLKEMSRQEAAKILRTRQDCRT